MLHSQLAAFALAAITLAVSGCGGSSKTVSTSASVATTTAATSTPVTTTSTSSPPVRSVTVKVASGAPLTRAQWIAKGDAICTHLNAELETISVNKASELPRVLPQEAAYERNAFAKLVKLVPPTTMANDWRQYLTDLLQAAEDSTKLASENIGESLITSPLARATLAVRARSTQIAKHDGFKECSVT